MTKTGTELSAEQAAVPEGTRDTFLDLLLEHWLRIAAVAWDGWLVHGRGTVTIEDGSVPPVLAYRPGSPCQCHASQVEAYDPERLDRDARRQVPARRYGCAARRVLDGATRRGRRRVARGRR